MHESHCPDIGPVCQQRDEPPQLHDQWLVVTETRGALEIGLWNWLSVEAQLPFRLTATGIQYRHLDGTPFAPDYANLHHRDEVLGGLGDPWLSFRSWTTIAGVGVGARVGVSIPVGRTEPNPFRLGELGFEHQHVQLGTGTFDPIIGLEARRSFGRVGIDAYGQAELVLGTNRHGYRAGNRFAFGAAAGTALFDWLRGSAGLDVIHERPERWDGRVQQDGSLGRTDLLLGAALQVPAGPIAITVAVKVPVVTHVITGAVEQGQLSFPAIVTVGIQSRVPSAPVSEGSARK